MKGNFYKRLETKNIVKNLYGLLLFMGILFYGCHSETHEAVALEYYISETKKEYAPDKRVALFTVKAVETGNGYVLEGESNVPAAVRTLKEKLNAANIKYVDSIHPLPAPELKNNIQGVINLSVANLRGNPAHASELVTQALLGTPVKIFKREGGWSLVQTPDRYLSWVDDGGLETMSKEVFSIWKTSPKIIYIRTTGSSYVEPNEKSQIVSDLVAGSILKMIGKEDHYFKVQYPDGRIAFVKKAAAKQYSAWLDSLKPSGESLVTTAKTLMGLPYLWGGTSAKGVDCSGFTKTVYFMNGMVLPRDASQQVHAGKAIDSTKNFQNLLPGDLLFFGRKATDSTQEKVVHVGMWIGNNEFIHSSGSVHISSMDRNAADFDEYNYNRYLRSNRMLNQVGEGIINLTQTPLFKD